VEQLKSNPAMLIPANWVPEPLDGGGVLVADVTDDFDVVVVADVALAVVLVMMPVAGTH
jgi:hypothetical protein